MQAQTFVTDKIRLLTLTTDSHFGLGIVLDQYKGRIASLNFHLGPLVLKVQWIPDAKWLRERMVISQENEVMYRDESIALFNERFGNG